MKKEEIKKLIEIIVRRYLVPITGDDMNSISTDFNNRIKRDSSSDNEPIIYLDDSELDAIDKRNEKNKISKPYMDKEDEELDEMEDLSKKDLYRISSADNRQLLYKNWDVKHIDFMGDEENDEENDDELLESLDLVLDFVFDAALYPKDKDTRYNKAQNLLLTRDVENPIDHIDYFDDENEDTDIQESNELMTTGNVSKLIINDYNEELKSLNNMIKYSKEQIGKTIETWVKKEYEGVIQDCKNRISEIEEILSNISTLKESKNLLTEYGNFSENTKYTDWTDFKNKLKNAIKTGFKSVDELVSLMDMNLEKYNNIVENMILNWKDSVSKSLLHTIAHIGLQLPKQGDNIFQDLKQQTVFILIAGNGASRRDIYGNTNGVEGLGYLSRWDYDYIKNPKHKIGSKNEDEREKYITIGEFPATKAMDRKGIELINEIIQYIWLYSFYQHWKLKKEKIKLPKVLYRGIRISNLWSHKTLKPIIDEIWKKDVTYSLKRKEAIDIILNYIINKGLTKIADGTMLSFTASKPIASYFTNGEGIIISIDPNKVEIVTSEKTDPLFDQPDYVSNKKEREYIVKIPSGYRFKKEDIIIEDLEYLIAEQNPLSVQFLDHDDKYAEYDLDGHHIKAQFWWNSSGTNGSVQFDVDNNYYESRGWNKKEFHFDPMPTEENLSRITNFQIKERKRW